ncbi:MAG: hypothetical protein K9W45_03255 [Candidatus Heimdallarchaeum aukensis]|uniref:Uncharacterized protein n=1 Tax=Candidatus Heimdallarchaeum aukensis TaxID=2876573 RepID=A0A9Y1FMC8_9ARCH|nr:MAG: hypothetical protein K9W45_03255 [Candidatus Heimdallarchaeum aukensis]
MKKMITNVKIPAIFEDVTEYTDDIINTLLDYYDFLALNSEDLQIDEVSLLKNLEELRERYNELTIKYSKLRKAYGVLFFENSELFRRNSMLALKLSKIQSKLNKMERQEGKNSKDLDFDLEKKKIKRFYNRYLAKKDTE